MKLNKIKHNWYGIEIFKIIIVYHSKKALIHLYTLCTVYWAVMVGAVGKISPFEQEGPGSRIWQNLNIYVTFFSA